MGDERVVKLVRWEATDVQAIRDCINKRIDDLLAQGKTVGIVAVIVSADPDGSGKAYEPAFSRMPIECAMWAADRLKRRAIQLAEEE